MEERKRRFGRGKRPSSRLRCHRARRRLELDAPHGAAHPAFRFDLLRRPGAGGLGPARRQARGDPLVELRAAGASPCTLAIETDRFHSRHATTHVAEAARARTSAGTQISSASPIGPSTESDCWENTVGVSGVENVAAQTGAISSTMAMRAVAIQSSRENMALPDVAQESKPSGSGSVCLDCPVVCVEGAVRPFVFFFKAGLACL